MMSKQRFTQFTAIGIIGFFLILALTNLRDAGQSAIPTLTDNQPQPVAAPTAISAPAKATPAPASGSAQPTIQPAPQPVPTPAGTAKESVVPATPSLLPVLLLGLLMGGTVILLLGFVIRLRPHRNRNVYQNILAEGVHA
ncbi:hypothetical protein [Candidatus Leptofilum sp.]|uniref:hypothetical protein n=1 Tax=Candidatus Leptofilum sp. TaxID=3241576 RepID=UPI003B5901C0